MGKRFCGHLGYRTTQILADPAKAMVDVICCAFQDVGIYRRLGNPELDVALGQWGRWSTVSHPWQGILRGVRDGETTLKT